MAIPEIKLEAKSAGEIEGTFLYHLSYFDYINNRKQQEHCKRQSSANLIKTITAALSRM